MELNDDILVQTTSPQTIVRVKRVKIPIASKSNAKDATDSVASFAPICMVCKISLA
jgi:hypothetical protein